MGRQQAIRAEKITQLEAEALNVEFDRFAVMPKQYHDCPDGGPTCVAWLDAMDAATLCHTALQKLGDMLRREAKITRASPCRISRGQGRDL